MTNSIPRLAPSAARSFIDITPRITPDIAVWPGDTPLSREIVCEHEKGATITLSA